MALVQEREIGDVRHYDASDLPNLEPLGRLLKARLKVRAFWLSPDAGYIVHYEIINSIKVDILSLSMNDNADVICVYMHRHQAL